MSPVLRRVLSVYCGRAGWKDMEEQSINAYKLDFRRVKVNDRL